MDKSLLFVLCHCSGYNVDREWLHSCVDHDIFTLAGRLYQ